jgi:ParB-like chromosome segregation protein Spo0J
LASPFAQIANGSRQGRVRDENRPAAGDHGPETKDGNEQRPSFSEIAKAKQAIPFHPLADIFPLMEGDEFDALVADIKANGLHERIILHEGMILDGRNRYRALLAAGLDPANANTLTIDGAKYVDDPVAFVISANIHRRHLTAGQKRDLIEKLIKAEPTKSNRQVAETVGVSHTHVNKVRTEMEEASDVETVSTSIDTRGREQPARKGWSRERYKQRRTKIRKVQREKDAALKKRREDDLEFLETEAERLAAKLIALDRDMARDLRRLLVFGGDADLVDALGAWLGPDDRLGETAADPARAPDDGLDIPECLRRSSQ